MTWTREKRALVEMREFEGEQVQHVIGWVGKRRECGCAYAQGMRMDDNEFTFGVVPCDQHGAANQRALETIKLMPPQDEEMHLLWERTLDREIEPWR